MTGSLVGNIDVAQVVLYAFWLFFAGLIWYLRQEDRREGYPLEEDVTGRYNKSPWLFVPPKKTFILPHGQGVRHAPDFKRDERTFSSRRIAPAPAAAGYLVVYSFEIILLFLCLAVLGPLTGRRYQRDYLQDMRFGLAELPG